MKVRISIAHRIFRKFVHASQQYMCFLKSNSFPRIQNKVWELIEFDTWEPSLVQTYGLSAPLHHFGRQLFLIPLLELISGNYTLTLMEPQFAERSFRRTQVAITANLWFPRTVSRFLSMDLPVDQKSYCQLSLLLLAFQRPSKLAVVLCNS